MRLLAFAFAPLVLIAGCSNAAPDGSATTTATTTTSGTVAATTAAAAAAPAPVGAEGLTGALGLTQPTAFAADGEVAVIVEPQRLRLVEPAGVEARLIGDDAASGWQKLSGAGVTDAWLRATFAQSIAADSASYPAVLAEQPTGAIYRADVPEAYVATAKGNLYHFAQAKEEAPVLRKLSKVPVPPILSAGAQKAKMDEFEANLPPCSEGKFPCRD